MTRNTGCVIWITGLSGSGKSTLADAVAPELDAIGYRVQCLDGDAVRGVFPSTGFSKEERVAHVKRMGFVASLLEKHGVVVLASFISPFEDSRNFGRGLCQNFVETHISTSLEVCEARDVKGLYKRARTGEITEFTGISAPYEEPTNPELRLDLGVLSLEEGVAQVVKAVRLAMGPP